MCMGYDKRANFVFAFLQVGCVRYDIVHPWSFLVGEIHPGVNHDDVIADFYSSHVFTDFLHTTKGDNSYDSTLRIGDSDARYIFILAFIVKGTFAATLSAKSFFGILV